MSVPKHTKSFLNRRSSYLKMVSLCGILSGFSPGAQAAVTLTINNHDAAGNQFSRFDVDGNSLDAHDGGLYLFGDTYYLYGTSYSCGYQYTINSTFCGFKVYSTQDLVHWTDKGFAVPPTSCQYCFRPHVMYNSTSKLYVMWSDAGGAYHVYTSPAPTGPFTRKPDPKLTVGGAVDEATFQDEDGTGWLIHNSVLPPAICCDMVVEKLTPDYLNTTGEFVKLGLGDVEGFAVFKRDGVFHAVMSDPSCAYCGGGTGEMTATSMLGPWSGAWYDPNGLHQSGNKEPRMRARIVNPNSCGGQPLVTMPVLQPNGSTAYYFISDRWNNRAPNESMANFFIGPMSFNAQGVLDSIKCVSSFEATLAVGTLGSYKVSANLDQTSGFEGFRHHCDINGTTQRQQSFKPSRSGKLTAATLTTFRSGTPTAPLTIDLLDASGAVLHTTNLPVSAIPWAPHVITVNPNVTVVAGQTYFLRMHSSTPAGAACYGMEYNETNVYAGGNESYSTNNGTIFTQETMRDLKFTVDIPSATAIRSNVPGQKGESAFQSLRGILVLMEDFQTVTTPTGMTGFALFNLAGQKVWESGPLQSGVPFTLPQGLKHGTWHYRWTASL